MNSITEFDIFFLSYDEPNAEKHWSDLLTKAPWAKRVHGVKGFDAAHRACAERSETDWFVTVDGDNIVRSEFFNIAVTLDTPRRCLSWNGINMLNGLMYGNGGLKLWSRDFVLTMNSHENATDPRKAVDFCWEEDYRQIHQPFSEVWITGSPYQAFRAGFREGVKLLLDRGGRVPASEMEARLHPQNLRNAMIWATVGGDHENGLWAVYGTRLAWTMMCDPAWDHTMVRDYDAIRSLWDGHRSVDLRSAVFEAGEIIRASTRLSLPVLDAATSDFFRRMMRFRND